MKHDEADDPYLAAVVAQAGRAAVHVVGAECGLRPHDRLPASKRTIVRQPALRALDLVRMSLTLSSCCACQHGGGGGGDVDQSAASTKALCDGEGSHDAVCACAAEGRSNNVALR